MHRLLLLMTTVSLALVGCSKSDENTNGGNCDIDVVSDYNTMIHNCRMAKSSSTCNSSVNSFLNKYPGINCKAEKSDPYSVDNQIVLITESYVQTLLSSPESSKSTPPNSSASTIKYKYGDACSGVVIDDYNSDVVGSCRSQSLGTSTDAKIYELCRDGIGRFIGKYPTINCKYTANSYETKYMTEKELLKTKKAMDEVIKLLTGDSGKVAQDTKI